MFFRTLSWICSQSDEEDLFSFRAKFALLYYFFSSFSHAEDNFVDSPLWSKKLCLRSVLPHYLKFSISFLHFLWTRIAREKRPLLYARGLDFRVFLKEVLGQGQWEVLVETAAFLGGDKAI